MRIAFCIRSLNNGGADRVAAALSMIWTDLGHEVVLLTLMPKANDEYKYSCLARRNLNFDALDASALGKLQAEFSFNLVIFNDAVNGTWFNNVFNLWGEMKTVKRIVILHHPCTNWFYTLGNAGDVAKVGLLSLADAVVSVDAIHALWWHYCGCKSVFIPNPAAVGFSGEHHYQPSRKLVWVGRTGDYCKRFLDALESFVQLASCDERATLTVVGAVDGSVRRRVKRILPRQLESRVRFLGLVTQPDSILADAALYLFTSNSEATIPQVVLEAQAMGLPIIAYDIPDLGTLTESDGVVKVDEHDGNMAKGIKELLDEPQRLVALSKAALASFAKRKKTASYVDGWKRLFNCLGKAHSPEELIHLSDNYLNEFTQKRLALEILHAERHFIDNHLPELKRFKQLKQRLSICYYLGRVKVHVLQLLFRMGVGYAGHSKLS